MPTCLYNNTLRNIPLSFFLLIFSAVLTAAEYHVDQSSEKSVRFLTEAPFEDIECTSDNIDGFVYWESDDFPSTEAQLEDSQLHFEIDLNTLDGGNSMYNKHLYSNYLETPKYPYAVYEARLTSIVKRTDTSLAVMAEGIFSIHGREKPLTVTADIYPAGEGFTITCHFVVVLTDYNIDIPKMLFLKIDENIKVDVKFALKPAP